MRAIWKYTLPPLPTTVDIQMPWQAQILSVRWHLMNGQEVIGVWVLVDATQKLATRRFHIAGTGHALNHGERAETYLATVQTAADQLVWHVFDGGWKKLPANTEPTQTHAR